MKILLTLSFFSWIHWSQAQNQVIVELFTSQGCSSCPAADKNLADIIEKAEANGQQVIGLSFHVDYWNFIGWKDPYSKQAFTDRQRKYATHLNAESVYTPQLVINGERELVGSDKTNSEKEISKALLEKMQIQIALDEVNFQNGKFTVSYSLDQNPMDELINIAFVEKNVGNEVTRGENSGRRLAHRNVVRSFASFTAQKKGELELLVPAQAKSGLLILYLQNRQWHVTGAVSKIF